MPPQFQDNSTVSILSKNNRIVKNTSLKYFFILGNHPKLSIAELTAVLGQENFLIGNSFALFPHSTEDCKTIQNRLGGTIKSGFVIGSTDHAQLTQDCVAAILKHCNTSKKIYFGISVYNARINSKKIALEIKKKLREKNISARWVESREGALSSVVVKTNKLLSKRGIELIVLGTKDGLHLGKTLAVQPFDEFSRRDYARPARDAKSGMLPPKLARMMINLARVKKSAVILDPFCGSGTILQECLILQNTQLTGTDISKKAIEDTQKNLQWLNPKNNVKLFECDAREIANKIKPHSIDAIITEPYLGPPQKGNESKEAINKTQKELRELYRSSLKEFTKILKPQGKIVIIFPIIKNTHIDILNTPNELEFFPDPTYTHLYNDRTRHSFLYKRPGQKVQREILILKKRV